MPLEQDCSLGQRQSSDVGLRGRLVARIADGDARIALPHLSDHVDLQVVDRRGVDGHAVHQREGVAGAAEKLDDVIPLVDLEPTAGKDHRKLGRGDLAE